MFFPEIITKLPKADIPLEGIYSYLMQGDHSQLVFFEFPEDKVIQEHSHGAQWGIVVKGKMELTINGQTNTMTKGDSYFIKAGEKHSALIYAGFCVIDFFEDRDRYKKVM